MNAQVRYQVFSEFFEKLALSFQQGDLDTLSTMFAKPWIAVLDEPIVVAKDAEHFNERLTKLLQRLTEEGIVDINAKLNNVVSTTEDMYCVHIEWKLMDTEDNAIRQYTTSYIIKLQNDQPKIVTVVADESSDIYRLLLDDSI